MFIKLILCFLVLIVVPEILGLLITNFIKEKNNIFLAFVLGYLLEFASFELIYLPMYFANCTFKMVQYVWISAILILFVVSIFVNRSRFKDIFQENIEFLKNMPNFIFVFIILLLIQICIPVFLVHTDSDDAFYVGTTTTSIETNSLYKFNAYTGEKNDKAEARYFLSGLTIYYAVVSQLVHIHPTILIHTVLPAIYILLAYIIYALIGNELFEGDKEKVSYFLFFLSIIFIFGYISIYTNFAFLLYRNWQGKAVLANTVIPAVFLLSRKYIENNDKIIYFLIFLMASISACFVTEMGVFLIPIEIGVLTILEFIDNKKIFNAIKMISCCIPQFIIGTLYIILK